METLRARMQRPRADGKIKMAAADGRRMRNNNNNKKKTLVVYQHTSLHVCIEHMLHNLYHINVVIGTNVLQILYYLYFSFL